MYRVWPCEHGSQALREVEDRTERISHSTAARSTPGEAVEGQRQKGSQRMQKKWATDGETVVSWTRGLAYRILLCELTRHKGLRPRGKWGIVPSSQTDDITAGRPQERQSRGSARGERVYIECLLCEAWASGFAESRGSLQAYRRTSQQIDRREGGRWTEPWESVCRWNAHVGYRMC